MKKNKIYQTLLYLTNNGTTSKDEVMFDIIFFCLIALAVLISIPIFAYSAFTTKLYGDLAWAALVLIFAIEAWDNMRHNRK